MDPENASASKNTAFFKRNAKFNNIINTFKQLVSNFILRLCGTFLMLLRFFLILVTCTFRRHELLKTHGFMQYQILKESRQNFVIIRKHDLAMTKSGHIFANGSYLISVSNVENAQNQHIKSYTVFSLFLCPLHPLKKSNIEERKVNLETSHVAT